MSDPLKPSPALLAKLASVIYHLEEYLDTGHPFDKAAAVSAREDAEVENWFGEMASMGMTPVKREHT
jgi:hypothetical protein